jgi:tetratricopeptide (TPR) repeat protein
MREALGERHPALIGNLSYLAEAYRLKGDYSSAQPLYREALEIAESAFGANNESVATALNNLGLIYHMQKRYSDAGPLLERAAAIVESMRGTNDPGLSTSLGNLAALYKDEGRYQDARRLLERSIDIAERAFGLNSPNAVPLMRALAGIYIALENDDSAAAVYRRLMASHWNADVTTASSALETGPDDFARVLNLAYFRGDKLDAALARLDDRITNGQPDETFFAVLSRNLYAVELDTEAEKTMQRAVEKFPDSWYVRYEQGQLYAQMNRWKMALQAYEQAAAMSDPQLDPRIKTHQRGAIYLQVARAHEQLFESDEAVSAYEQALEFEPDSVDSLVELGNVLLNAGRLDEATMRYSAAAAHNAVSAPAHQGLSEVHLRRGQLEEARTAAEKAILIDSKNRKAHYLRAMTLFRAGRNAEAEQELALYQQLEAAERAEENTRRDVAVLNKTAISGLEKDPAGSIALFQNGIQRYPEAGTLRLSLGLAQHRLGNHEAALQAFTSALGLKLDDHFLVHLSLSDEYLELGDRRAEKRHHTLYLQEYESALSANRAN